MFAGCSLLTFRAALVGLGGWGGGRGAYSVGGYRHREGWYGYSRYVCGAVVCRGLCRGEHRQAPLLRRNLGQSMVLPMA